MRRHASSTPTSTPLPRLPDSPEHGDLRRRARCGSRVPATVANLGPGFDAFGLALSLCDELEAEVLPTAVCEVEVTGAGADDVPRDESHLVVRAMRAAFDAMGAQPPGLALHCHNAIPHGRGLGSSSAAIVAGVVAGPRARRRRRSCARRRRALRSSPPSSRAIPTTLPPALYGGSSSRAGGRASGTPSRAGVDPRVQRRRLRPARRRSRPRSRAACCPTSVPHADAAANAGRAALLVAALTGQPEHLLRRHGGPAAPGATASRRCRRRWHSSTRCAPTGVAAVVSGAGPTVLALTRQQTVARPRPTRDSRRRVGAADESAIDAAAASTWSAIDALARGAAGANVQLRRIGASDRSRSRGRALAASPVSSLAHRRLAAGSAVLDCASTHLLQCADCATDVGRTSRD